MSNKKEISPGALLIAGAIGYDAMQKGRNPFWAIIRWFFVYPAILLGVGSMILTAINTTDSGHPPPDAPGSATTSMASPPPSVAVPAPIASAAVPAEVNHLGSVLYDTAVDSADGTVIGMVHAGRPVHIIATNPAYGFRIRLHNGKEGFVAADAVADTGDWVGSAPERAGSP